MAALRKHPDELRERATRMATELRQDPGQAGRDRSGRAARNAPQVTEKLGPAAEIDVAPKNPRAVRRPT